MALFDTRIPLSTKSFPVAVEDPLEREKQQLTLENLALQQRGHREDLRGVELQNQARQRDFDAEKSYRDLRAGGKSARDLLGTHTKFAAPEIEAESKARKAELDAIDQDLKNRALKTEQFGQLIGSIKDPLSFGLAIEQGRKDKFVTDEEANEYYALGFNHPQVQAKIKQARLQAVKTHDQIKLDFDELKNQREALQAEAQLKKTNQETENLKNPLPMGEYREFKQSFYPGWLQKRGITEPTAQHEMEALNEFKQPKRAPVPGVDTPLSPTVEAQRGRMAAAGRAAGANAQANPDTVNAILNDPKLYNDLTPTQKARVMGPLAKANFQFPGAKPSESAIKKVSSLSGAVADGERLRGVLNQFSDYVGPISGLAAKYPYAEDARKAQAAIDLVRQRVGKALEEGVLRKEDEEKYKKILPTLNDTMQVAMYKLDLLNETLNSDLGIFVEQQQRGGRNMQMPERKGGATSSTSGGGDVIVWERGPDGKARRKQ